MVILNQSYPVLELNLDTTASSSKNRHMFLFAPLLRLHRRLSLRTSLVVYVLLPMGLVTAAGGWMGLNAFESQVEQQMQRDLEMVARAIELPLRHALQRGREGSIAQALKSAFAMSHVYSAYLYDVDGRLLSGTSDLEEPSEKDDDVRDEVTKRLAAGERHGEYDKVTGRQVYAYFVPLTDAGGRITGLLRLTRRYSDFESRIRTIRFRAAGAFLFAFLALTGAVLYGHHLVFGAQLKRLFSSMSRISRGDLAHRYQPDGPRDIIILGNHFNKMMDNINRAEKQINMQRQRQLSLEEQLRQKEKLAAIGELAAGVAHELGNPLSLVDAKTQRALRQPALAPRQQKDFKVIRREANRMTRIIRQLLDFSSSPPIEKRQVSASTLLDAALTSVAIEAEASSTRLVASHNRDRKLQVDPARIEQALVNLMRNAIQASAGGLVKAGWENGADSLTFFVEDDGPGIAREHLPKIFDPFFTTKPVGRGTGLGLAVVHGIAREHHGSVEVATNAPRGACFRLTLPCQPPADDSPPC